MAIGQPQRDEIEHNVAGVVAQELGRAAAADAARISSEFIDRGHALASKMSWDVVARDYVLPGIQRASRRNGSSRSREPSLVPSNATSKIDLSKLTV